MNLADGNSQKDNDPAAGRKRKTLLEECHHPALDSDLPRGMTSFFEPQFLDLISSLLTVKHQPEKMGSPSIPLLGLLENKLSLVSEGPS